MGKDPTDRNSHNGDEIEREVRSGRKFSLADAIGRSARGLLKGVSPITRRRQTEVAVENLLEDHLRDSEGTLTRALLRRVVGSEAILESYGEPREALKRVVGALLASDDLLCRFVTAVDAEWGRQYAERPHFERDGRPPDEDDPYTREGVRRKLAHLLDRLVEAP